MFLVYLILVLIWGRNTDTPMDYLLVVVIAGFTFLIGAVEDLKEKKK